MAVFKRKPKRRKLSDDELLKVALDQLASSERHMDTVMEKVEYSRLVLKGATHPDYGKSRNPNDPKDWESREFPPIAFEHAELLQAELSLDDPRFSFVARNPRREDAADRAEDALDYYLDRDRFGRTFRLAMKAAVRDGAAVIKFGWAPDRQPMFNVDGSPTGQYTSGGGRLRAILHRLEDTFPDPTATCEEDLRFIFFKSHATTDDLYARKDANGNDFYSNLDLLEEHGSPDEGPNAKRDEETEEAFHARTTGTHTLHERWTPYGRVTIANKSVIIRRDDSLPQRHGKLPVAIIRLIESEDSLFGTSPIGLIGPLQDMWHFYFNKLADAVHLAVKPPMLADTEEDPDAAQQVVYPNAVLNTRNGEQTLKVMKDVADLSKYDIQNLLGMVRDLMERITGMNSAIAGQANSETATESAMNLRQGKGRSGSMLDVSDECWARFADLAYQTIQQYSSEAVMARLSGIDGREIAFDGMQLEDMMISAKPAANERALRDLERQDTDAAMSLVLELAGAQGTLPQINPNPIFERWADSLGIDPRGFIVGPPPPPPPAEAPQQQGAAPAPPAQMSGPGTPDDVGGGEPDILDEMGNPLPGVPQ